MSLIVTFFFLFIILSSVILSSVILSYGFDSVIV